MLTIPNPIEILIDKGYNELYPTDRLLKQAKEELTRLQKIEDLGWEVLDWLNKAPFDYSNGNLDPTGTIDEGNVLGWKGHKEIVDKLTEILDEDTK